MPRRRRSMGGGRTGIRTQGRVAPLTVFKTVAFVRSAALPAAVYLRKRPWPADGGRSVAAKLPPTNQTGSYSSHASGQSRPCMAYKRLCTIACASSWLIGPARKPSMISSVLAMIPPHDGERDHEGPCVVLLVDRDLGVLGGSSLAVRAVGYGLPLEPNERPGDPDRVGHLLARGLPRPGSLPVVLAHLPSSLRTPIRSRPQPSATSSASRGCRDRA
jgi:hypothetical protein